MPSKNFLRTTCSARRRLWSDVFTIHNGFGRRSIEPPGTARPRRWTMRKGQRNPIEIGPVAIDRFTRLMPNSSSQAMLPHARLVSQASRTRSSCRKKQNTDHRLKRRYPGRLSRPSTRPLAFAICSEMVPREESYATTDTTNRCLSPVKWRERERWHGGPCGIGSSMLSRRTEYSLFVLAELGSQKCPPVAQPDGAPPPKAEATRSNRVAQAILPRVRTKLRSLSGCRSRFRQGGRFA